MGWFPPMYNYIQLHCFCVECVEIPSPISKYILVFLLPVSYEFQQKRWFKNAFPRTMDHTQITMAFVHVSLSSNCCCAAAAALAVSYHGRKKTVWPYSSSPQKNHPKKKHISSNTCKPWSVKALRLHQDRPLVWSSHVFVFLSDDEDVKRKAGNEHPASVETFATPPLSRRGPPWTVPGPGGTLSCILRIACDKVEWSCIELKPFLFLYVYVSFAGL